MSNKVLVTKEFHRRALAAIERVKVLEAMQDEANEVVRLAWMSFMECRADDELIKEFMDYCDEFKEELGLGELIK